MRLYLKSDISQNNIKGNWIDYRKKFWEKKARIEILENENKQLKRNVKLYKKTIKQNNFKISRELVKNSKYQQSVMNLKIHETELKKTNKQNESEITVLRDTIESNEHDLASAEENKTELQDARLTIDYMQLYDETSNKYTNCLLKLWTGPQQLQMLTEY